MTDTINGRTPDEIKKALQCRVKGCLEKCDHRCDMCELYVPNYRLEDRYADAHAYILQLESRLAQVERERDAMLLDMQRYSMCCACKHFVDGKKCPMHDDCDYAKVGHFEWRGVCSENTKESSE